MEARRGVPPEVVASAEVFEQRNATVEPALLAQCKPCDKAALVLLATLMGVKITA